MLVTLLHQNMGRKLTSEHQTMTPLSKKKGLRLNDSMEFYRANIATLPPAPDPLEEQIPEEEATCVEDEEVELHLTEIKKNRSPQKHVEFEEEEESSSEESDEESIVVREWGDSDIEFDQSEEEDYSDKIDFPFQIPFWFGAEDPDQIKFIMNLYGTKLNLQEEAKQRIREPESFVGRVKRSIVKDPNAFLTLDEVEIFKRGLLPPCSLMPPVRSARFLTTWSQEEGVPKRFDLLSCEQFKEWAQRASREEVPSYLLCLPNYGEDDFHYFVSEDRREVTHSPHSQQMETRFSYEKYLPKFKRPTCDFGDV